MFTQVGVKTVVAGGRPTTGPMQAVGGRFMLPLTMCGLVAD